MVLEDQPRVHHVDLELQTVVMRGSYAVSRRLALEVEMPLRNVKTMAAFEDVNGAFRDDFSSIHHRNETIRGVGDLLVAGRWRLSRPAARSTEEVDQPNETPKSRWLTDIVFGVSAPTGGIEEDPFVLGAEGRRHQHVFFGSGTWDPSVRVEMHRGGQAANLYSWAGGGGALYNNKDGYRRGFAGSAGFGVSTNLGRARTAFQAQLELQHAEPSTWRSQAARNSGSTDLVLALGMSYQLSDALTARGQLRLPENVAARSGVLEPKAVALFGLSYSRFK